MTILESITNQKIVIKLEFLKPWKTSSIITFIVTPYAAGSQTLTWQMDGNYNFMGKAFSLFMNMDKMVGKDFESGLTKIKAQVEHP